MKLLDKKALSGRCRSLFPQIRCMGVPWYSKYMYILEISPIHWYALCESRYMLQSHRKILCALDHMALYVPTNNTIFCKE